MIPRNEPSLSSGEGLVSGAKINVIPSPAPEFGYCEILMVKVVLIIAGHASTGDGVAEPPVRERDLGDIERDDLRRQVEHLQQRLQHLEGTREAAPNGSSEEEGSINDGVEIPEFEGRMQPEEFVDWLNTVERIFEYRDVPEDRKVKLIAIKLKKYASLWWENLKRQREREGRRKIVTWEKMKKELKRKFLPNNYRQDIYLKFHNFRQRELSVEEDYTAEFDNLMMKCDLVEAEEHTIARYLGGLKPEIGNVVQLQPYWTYSDVSRLALKVEKQQKDARGGGIRFTVRDVNRGSGSVSKHNSGSNSTAKKITRIDIGEGSKQ
ncbi:hypothetical protein WN943_000329 [Citrus x changshan-huyou]